MKNIIKSLVIVIAVAAIAGGASYAYFTSTVTVGTNTFSAGTLVIKVDSAPSTFGFTLTNAIPGSCTGRSVTINNNVAGTGTVDVSELVMNINENIKDLCPALTLKVDAARTGYHSGTAINLYNGDLNSIPADLSLFPAGQWTSLPVGAQQDLYLQACFPKANSDQSFYQGKSCTFDIAVQAFSGK
jgi:predicted ribosomally synthesized peptide with SipW-like signal peptide